MNLVPNSNTLSSSQTRSLNHRYLLYCTLKYTPVPVPRWSITLRSHGNATLRVALRQTHKTIPTTQLWHVKSSNIFSVGTRRKAWRHAMTTCWRKKTPVGIAQASATVIASRSSWLACQMIRLSVSGNYTPSRIWDGMTITNALLENRVEKTSKASDGWCGS